MLYLAIFSLEKCVSWPSVRILSNLIFQVNQFYSGNGSLHEDSLACKHSQEQLGLSADTRTLSAEKTNQVQFKIDGILIDNFDSIPKNNQQSKERKAAKKAYIDKFLAGYKQFRTVNE